MNCGVDNNLVGEREVDNSDRVLDFHRDALLFFLFQSSKLLPPFLNICRTFRRAHFSTLLIFFVVVPIGNALPPYIVSSCCATSFRHNVRNHFYADKYTLGLS